MCTESYSSWCSSWSSTHTTEEKHDAANMQPCYANNNPLTGTIPTEFGTCRNWPYFYTNQNLLTGASLRVWPINCTRKHHSFLQLYWGNNTHRLWQLTSLVRLDADKNWWSRTLPTDVGQLLILRDCNFLTILWLTRRFWVNYGILSCRMSHGTFCQGQCPWIILGILSSSMTTLLSIAFVVEFSSDFLPKATTRLWTERCRIIVNHCPRDCGACVFMLLNL